MDQIWNHDRREWIGVLESPEDFVEPLAELVDLHASAIGLVRKPANARPFYVCKDEGGLNMSLTQRIDELRRLYASGEEAEAWRLLSGLLRELLEPKEPAKLEPTYTPPAPQPPYAREFPVFPGNPDTERSGPRAHWPGDLPKRKPDGLISRAQVKTPVDPAMVVTRRWYSIDANGQPVSQLDYELDRLAERMTLEQAAAELLRDRPELFTADKLWSDAVLTGDLSGLPEPLKEKARQFFNDRDDEATMITAEFDGLVAERARQLERNDRLTHAQRVSQAETEVYGELALRHGRAAVIQAFRHRSSACSTT